MIKTWLVSFLDGLREILEAAETPIAKLATVILPLLAPLVPAILTSTHVYKLLLETYSNIKLIVNISGTAAVLTGVVLEFLGYVGVLSFIAALFRWIETRRNEYLVPTVLSGFSYVFYLGLMVLINVVLDRHFGTPVVGTQVFGALSFLSVPTGMLAANSLAQRTSKLEIDALRREDREYKLERLKIRHGIASPQVSSDSRSDWRLLSEGERREIVHVLKPEEIMRKYGVSRSTAFGWKSKNPK